jgi:hypothetical protein
MEDRRLIELHRLHEEEEGRGDEEQREMAIGGGPESLVRKESEDDEAYAEGKAENV